MSYLSRLLKDGALKLEVYETRFYLVRAAFYLLRLASGRLRFRRSYACAILFGPLLYKRVVLHMLFEVASPCQNHCAFCAHADMISRDIKYQMSLEQVRSFIRFTQESHYFIENLWINGPGEPTLWKHLNEGIRLLHDSGVVGNINLTSNGQSLDKIDDRSWKLIHRVSVSMYPSIDPSRMQEHVPASPRAGRVVRERIKDSFRVFPERRYEHSLPARCTCPGPMIHGDWIYFHCGPAGFGAARLKGEPFFENTRYGVELKAGYLDDADAERTYGLVHPQRIEHLDLCRYCWANYSIALPEVPHSQIRLTAPL